MKCDRQNQVYEKLRENWDRFLITMLSINFDWNTVNDMSYHWKSRNTNYIMVTYDCWFSLNCWYFAICIETNVQYSPLLACDVIVMVPSLKSSKHFMRKLKNLADVVEHWSRHAIDLIRTQWALGISWVCCLTTVTVSKTTSTTINITHHCQPVNPMPWLGICNENKFIHP